MTTRDDARTHDSLMAADEAASVAHDYIWNLNHVTKQQASDAIHTIHGALRPLLSLDNVTGNLEGDRPGTACSRCRGTRVVPAPGPEWWITCPKCGAA